VARLAANNAPHVHCAALSFSFCIVFASGLNGADFCASNSSSMRSVCDDCCLLGVAFGGDSRALIAKQSSASIAASISESLSFAVVVVCVIEKERERERERENSSWFYFKSQTRIKKFCLLINESIVSNYLIFVF